MGMERRTFMGILGGLFGATAFPAPELLSAAPTGPTGELVPIKEVEDAVRNKTILFGDIWTPEIRLPGSRNRWYKYLWEDKKR